MHLLIRFVVDRNLVGKADNTLDNRVRIQEENCVVLCIEPKPEGI